MIVLLALRQFVALPTDLRVVQQPIARHRDERCGLLRASKLRVIFFAGTRMTLGDDVEERVAEGQSG
jgi:hypothetical protein